MQTQLAPTTIFRIPKLLAEGVQLLAGSVDLAHTSAFNTVRGAYEPAKHWLMVGFLNDIGPDYFHAAMTQGFALAEMKLQCNQCKKSPEGDFDDWHYDETVRILGDWFRRPGVFVSGWHHQCKNDMMTQRPNAGQGIYLPANKPYPPTCFWCCGIHGGHDRLKNADGLKATTCRDLVIYTPNGESLGKRTTVCYGVAERNGYL